MLLLTASLFAACSGSPSLPGTSSQSPGAAFRVFVDASGTVERLDSTSEVAAKLPGDVLSPDGRHLYAVYGRLVRSFDTGTGAMTGELQLPQLFAQVGGQSPSGTYLALTGASDLVSWFAVVSSKLIGPVRTAVLDGGFSFDALSDDGRWLYLIEHVDSSLDYRVRRYDLDQGQLDPNVLVEKGALATAVMNGQRYASIGVPAWRTVYSLYFGTNGAFVHALSLDQAPISCIDLPGPRAIDSARQQQWTLALSPAHDALFAVNAAVGAVSRIDLATLGVTSGSFSPPSPSAESWSLVTQASAKELEGGSAVVSPDGKTLYATALHGYVAIDTASLVLKGSYFTNSSLNTLAMTPDGRRLLAVRDLNRLVEIVPADGRLDRVLLAVYGPLALLRVDPV